MGRTYDALSHSRVKRIAQPEMGPIPPTTIYPLAPAETPVSEARLLEDSDFVVNVESEDTALEELGKDDQSVPYIEVGGPKGSPPLLSPDLANTPIPNPRPLKLEPASVQLLPTPSSTAPTPVAVGFFPLSDRIVPDPKRVSRDLLAFHQPDHGVSGQYRAMLAGLKAQHPGVGCPLLTFTTVGHVTDAARVILNVAITRAREENKRILVIEANHEQPLLAELIGVNAQPGMRELLNRTVPMSVAIQATAQPDLYILPPGDPDLPVPHEAEERLPGVVDLLRKRFDWLLVNGPEWGSGGSAEWASLGDAVYLVVRHDQWDSPEVEAAHQAIVQARNPLRGYVTLRAG